MSKGAYTLIIMGLILLAYNYGMIDFSLLTHRLALPITFIAAGMLGILKGIFNFGEIGEVLSGIMALILILSIIFNVTFFFMPLRNISSDSIIELNSTFLSAAFFDLSFNSNMSHAIIMQESLESSSSEAIEYSSIYAKDFSIMNSFSDSTYDFLNFMANNLDFKNNFGECDIINSASIEKAYFENNFGDMQIKTGEIIGEREIVIENSFGSLELIIDKDASFMVESSNAFGTIRNNVGLQKNDYDSSINKIIIIAHNSFGTITISKE